MSSAIAASTDSILSTIRLPESGKSDAAQNTLKFAISVAFLDFKDLSSFCKLFLRDQAPSSQSRTFWLSWVLFDKTFQSEEFSADDADPKRVRDTIRVRCSEEAMEKTLTNDSCMRVFLCTQGSVLAAIGMPLLTSASGVSPSCRGNSSAWHDLEYSPSLFSSSHGLNKPAVKVSISIEVDEDVPSSSQGGQRDLGVQGAFGAVPPSFSTSTSRIPRRSPPSSPPTAPEVIDAPSKDSKELKEVRFSTELPDESERRNTKRKGAKTASKTNNRDQDDFCETSSEDAGDSVDTYNDPFEEEDDVDDYTRHYRVNVEVRSIGGLKRAANAAIHFTYPFLGAGGPIRTHPLWLPANTEGKIDGAVASYDCCMSRNRIKDILSEHPLKVSALSRTHLGSANIGDVVVDLFGCIESKPHSYRCSMTNKTFKAKEEYTAHRQSLLALRSLGKVNRAPPKDPIVIWANDSYLPLTAPDKKGEDSISLGGRLRVVVIIEEISIVGAEIATPVRPGYKMHNGALYEVKDPQDPLSGVGGQGVGGGGELEGVPPTPLDRVGLSEAERAVLEKLKADWEAFRSASEVQWRDSLREREIDMRNKLVAESSSTLADRADDLRRAQGEAGRLEVRLRGAIDEAERQKTKLKLKEEQMQMNLAQKTSELQLLQRRVRDEAKSRIDTEVQKSESLLSQISSQKQQIERAEKRVQEVEREFESFRSRSRGTPESVLREEVARLRATLGECRAEVERERRVKSEAELEKEHYRAQMHRLAIALKRERERSAASARQDLDQLRLEFLAREERYVLDGDREELRNIRHELANLRSNTHGQAGLGQEHGPTLAPVNQQQPQPHQQQVQQQGHGQQTQPSSMYPTQTHRSDSPPTAPQRFQPTPSPPQPTAKPQSPPQGLQQGPTHDSRRESGGSVGSKSFSGEVDEKDDDEDESPRTPISFSFPYNKEPSKANIPNVTNTTSIMSIFGSEMYAPPVAMHHHSQRASPIPQPQTSKDSKKLEQGHGQQTQHELTQEEEDAQFLADYPEQISPRETVKHIKRQIYDLLQTGMYSDDDDPVISALKAELHKLENNL